MSSTRYLEIDSTYRNRTQYPNPADFIVMLSQSGTKSAMNAVDPVSDAAPLKIWSPNEYVNPTGIIRQNDTNNLTRFMVCYDTVDTVSKVINYYVGTTIIDPLTISNTVVITNWEFVGTFNNKDCFNVSVNPSLTGLQSAIKTGTQNVNFVQGTVLVTTLPPVFFIPNGVIADNYYTGYIMYNQTINQWRPIISYDGVSKLAGIDLSDTYGGTVYTPNPTPWGLGHTYVLRKTIPQEIGSLTVLTPNKVELPITSSSAYAGSFIRFTSGSNDNKICSIMDYNVSTKICIVNCMLNTTGPNQNYEILQSTRDNEVPFTYTGSSVSQQEMSCYEIELIDLILPNITLVNGGKIAYYPYVYVELQNVSTTGAGLTNILYSNNPNSTRKLFRCPIDDMRHHCISPFINIDSDGTKQTIKFKLNDCLHFAVYLHNGKLFETLYPETYSPGLPNPLIQISALFSLRKLY